jgi:hypothetical protein
VRVNTAETLARALEDALGARELDLDRAVEELVHVALLGDVSVEVLKKRVIPIRRFFRIPCGRATWLGSSGADGHCPLRSVDRR